MLSEKATSVNITPEKKKKTTTLQ